MRVKLINIQSKVKKMSTNNKILLMNDFTYLSGSSYYKVSIDKFLIDPSYNKYKELLKKEKELVESLNLYYKYDSSIVTRSLLSNQTNNSFADILSRTKNQTTSEIKDEIRKEIKKIQEKAKLIKDSFESLNNRDLKEIQEKITVMKTTDDNWIKVFSSKKDKNDVYVISTDPLKNTYDEDLTKKFEAVLIDKSLKVLKSKTNLFKIVRF